MSDLLFGNGLADPGGALASLGSALVERACVLNVWTAALLGGALVLDRALARRTRASLRIALYAPVALRVLLPLDWSLRLGAAPSVDAFLAPLVRLGAPPVAERAASQAPSWQALVAVAYLAVVVLLAARAVVARVRLARSVAGASPVLALSAVPCPVVQHDELGPMVVGLFAPRVVLPRRLLAPGEEHALDCVVRHEAAHLGRKDAWLSASMQLLAIVAWPVVPVWIAVARVRHLVELACDEAALDGADRAERLRYGHALLDIAGWRSLAIAPLGAGELHFGSTLRARIEALATHRQWPLAAQALAASIASIALLVACSGSSAPAPATTAAPGDDGKGYGYEFDKDSAKAAKSGPSPADATKTNADGRLAPEVIQATVRAHFGALQACYEAGLKTNAKLAGTVAVKYAIREDGTTTGAEDERSTLPDGAVVACVVGEFKKLTYPKPKGGVVTVIYPVEFAP
jgi:beta-lactamase regulating signal transducer with metallopeptidase domain